MSNSLQDQLRALGLAKKAPAKQNSKGKRRKPRKEGGAVARSEEIDLDRAYRLRQQAERRQADEARQRKMEEDRRRRQVNKDIQVIVAAQRLNDPKAELKRNFMYKGRIRSVLVTEEQLRALNAGELGLVFLKGSYHLLPPAALEQVRAISGEHVPDLSVDSDGDEDGDHPVPDDLVW